VGGISTQKVIFLFSGKIPAYLRRSVVFSFDSLGNNNEGNKLGATEIHIAEANHYSSTQPCE
jgi:hypothetical protein